MQIGSTWCVSLCAKDTTMLFPFSLKTESLRCVPLQRKASVRQGAFIVYRKDPTRYTLRKILLIVEATAFRVALIRIYNPPKLFVHRT